MIILGATPRYKTIGKGQFYCPHCGATTLYERKKATRYFTLYFIPIFPMGEMGEVVQCQTCHTIFEPGVLNFNAPERKLTLSEMLNDLKPLLDGGMPIEYLVRDLTAAGLERSVALALIDTQIGSERNACHNCGLTYSPNVSTCAECHNPLKPDA